MPNFKITPSSALLTSGQAVTLQAKDDANGPVTVTWTLTPQLGTLVTTSTESSSAAYVAPSVVQAPQTVAVIAASSEDTCGVTISLTPDAISILPAAVTLSKGQKQQFVAVLASGASDDANIQWNLSPQAGDLDATGLYTAPASVPDDGTVTVTAVATRLGRTTTSKVTLAPEPWRGPSTVLLAGYIFLIFCVVYLLIGLWPSEISNIDALKVDQAQAQSSLDKSKLALQTALGTSGDANKPVATASPSANSDRQKASDAVLGQLSTEMTEAQKALSKATTRLTEATSSTVDTSLVKPFNREIDLICIVLLAGALGSFLHMAQSFSDFAGNRKLKSSWVWWYCFLPFVGAGLALVIYGGLRGGIITLAATPAIKASDLNPYGLLAAGSLAGLFSKSATKKLGEIFETAFQSSKAPQTIDTLKPGPQNGAQTPKPGATGSVPAPDSKT